MEFNSRICTTKEQSERLLALGLKKETADCNVMLTIRGEMYHIGFDMCRYRDYYFRYGREHNYQPAWSLHRLLEMLPQGVIIAGTEYKLSIDSHLCVEYISEETQSRVVMSGELSNPIRYFWKGDVFDRIICCICWLIKEGYFNKEYLEDSDERPQ